ncbi:Crp/Fnr family transcriptional regulator [Listeria booriae]|uniref:Crp/Fnr family transcriptional regulator n=1 Tax=Listeria booriae TaxID=1552123 RepID=UPI001628594A|nr:Crp/Fnr family transcriptional regulator [Listeria booriae]MBC1285480.1 Crp/Fnr family transcriptional regulator [Listeria booriae]
MYNSEYINSLTNYNRVLLMLNKSEDFYEHSHQLKLKKGEKIYLDAHRDHCYLIQSGFIQVSNVIDDKPNFLYISQHGDFPVLPVVSKYIPKEVRLEVLADALVWVIDFQFLKNCLLLEDPKNFVLISQMENVIIDIARVNTLAQISAQQRIQYLLEYLVENFGIVDGQGYRILPPFLTYNKLSEFSNLSKSHTIKIVEKLKEDGLITIKKGQWIILDIDAIRVSHFFVAPFINRKKY